jgi:hypothetical protein
MLGAYLALPWIVARVAQTAAGANGFSEVVLRIERPGLHGMRVPEVRLVSPALTLVAANARLDYTLGELWQGRLIGIEVQELQLTLNESEQAATASDGADFSPESLFPVLPVQSIQIRRLQLEVPALQFVGDGAVLWGSQELSLALNGIAPEEASRFAFDATLSKSGLIHVLFRGTEGDGADILRASGKLSENLLTLNGRFDVRGYALALVSAVAGVPEGEGAIDGTFDVVVPWPPQSDLNWQDLNLKLAEATLQWAAASEDLALNLAVASLDAYRGELDAVLSGTITATWEDAPGKLEFPVGYRVQYRDGVVRGGSGPKLEFAREDARLRADLQSFSLHPAVDVQAGFEADAVLNAEDVKLAGRLTGQVSPVRGEVAYAGEVEVMGAAQRGEMTASYQIDADRVSVAGKVTAGQVRGAGFELVYDRPVGSGHFEMAHALQIRKPLVASMLPDWTEDYDVDGGRLDANVRASWRAPDTVSGDIVLKLDKIAAHYEDYRVTDMAGTLELSTERLGAAAWQLAPASLTATALDVGFPVTGLRLDIAADGAMLTVANASGHLLGGRARTAPFDYDMNAGNAQLELTLEDIDLAAVLALEGDDVAGSGRLNGVLPVTVRDHQVSMQGGTVRSLPPGGTIRLAPALARATGQPGLDFALVALQDFRYSELRTDIDYAENGDMRLGVKLKGYNPAVERGRAIEYNLNITENLPILLESLRLQDQVRAQIERKLNR